MHLIQLDSNHCMMTDTEIIDTFQYALYCMKCSSDVFHYPSSWWWPNKIDLLTLIWVDLPPGYSCLSLLQTCSLVLYWSIFNSSLLFCFVIYISCIVVCSDFLLLFLVWCCYFNVVTLALFVVLPYSIFGSLR